MKPGGRDGSGVVQGSRNYDPRLLLRGEKEELWAQLSEGCKEEGVEKPNTGHISPTAGAYLLHTHFYGWQSINTWLSLKSQRISSVRGIKLVMSLSNISVYATGGFLNAAATQQQ